MESKWLEGEGNDPLRREMGTENDTQRAKKGGGF